MLVSDNEYGAPWNDQFYWVTVEDETGSQWDEVLTLSGPYTYSDQELQREAEGMFPEYNIIKVREYAIRG